MPLRCIVFGHKTEITPWFDWDGIWRRDLVCKRCSEVLYRQLSRRAKKPLDVF